jgi:hypothetical protein
MEAIRNFTGTPDKLSNDSNIRRLVEDSEPRNSGSAVVPHSDAMT